MAYWLIPFTSRNGDGYTIRISGAAGVNPITLKGAADPFVTQEDDDRDMFKPVRLQSGYLRIVDMGGTFDWHDLMPTSATSRKVELLKVQGGSSVVVWQGFIRPETFSGTFRELPQEREFPICCPLSTLESFDVSVADGHNFAWLILHLLTHYFSITIDEFVFSRPRDVVSWLQHRWQAQNLLDEEGKPKYNGLQLLEEICKFWGWVCRIEGTKVYFIQADDTSAGGFASITYNDMDDLSNYTGIQPTSHGWYTTDLSTERVIAGGTEEYVQGVKNVKVTANINKSEDLVNVSFDKWVDDYRTNPVTQTGGPQQWRFLLYDRIPTEQEGAFIEEMDNCWLTFQWGSGPRYGMMEVSELYEGDINRKHNYNLTGKVILHNMTQPTPNATNWIFRVTTKQIYSPGAGVLVLNMKRAQIAWGEDMSLARHVYFAVKFGNQWWNPDTQTWGSTFAVDNQYLNPTEFEDNRVLDGPYMPYTHYGIPVNGQSGIVEVFIYYTQVNSLGLGGVEISFVKTKTSDLPNDDTENVYEEKGVAAFQNDVNINTIFATDRNNPHGFGVIMTAGGAYADGVEYSTSGGSQQEHPEQHLVDRIAAYGSTVKKVLSVGILNEDLAPVSPATKMTDENGTTYTPVAISHEWADDITNYTMMEI